MASYAIECSTIRLPNCDKKNQITFGGTLPTVYFRLSLVFVSPITNYARVYNMMVGCWFLCFILSGLFSYEFYIIQINIIYKHIIINYIWLKNALSMIQYNINTIILSPLFSCEFCTFFLVVFLIFLNWPQYEIVRKIYEQPNIAF